MSLLAGVAWVALLVGAGCWPARALVPWLAGRGIFGRLALAVACGAAATGLLQVALGAVGVASGWSAPAVLAAISLLAGLRVRHVEPEDPPLPRALVALLALIAIVGTAAAAGTPFRSDGSKFWAPKARELARVGASEAPSLHEPQRLAVHREYPLLVPALMAPVFAASPPDATAGPKLVLGALQLALLGVLATLLRRHGSAGLLLLAAVASAPLLVSLDVRESAVAGGYVDGAEALFLLLLVACVQRARMQRDGSAFAGAALFGAALLSCKLEGRVELAIVLGAWLLCGPRRVPVLEVGAAALLLAAPSFVLQAGIAAVAPDEAGFIAARLSDAQNLVARSLPVGASLAGLLAEASCFGLLPLLLLARLWRTGSRFEGLLVAGLAAFLLASYLSTSMDALRHVQTSAHRLAWHWLPALALLAAREDERGR
jgi:hypothetical protein